MTTGHMRSHLRTAGAALVGFLLGGAFIGGYEAHVCRRISAELVLSAPRGRIIEDVNTLSALRAARWESVIADKEQDLSYALYAVSLDSPTRVLTDKMMARALRMAAQYRSAHPYGTGNRSVDQSVSNLLQTVPLAR